MLPEVPDASNSMFTLSMNLQTADLDIARPIPLLPPITTAFFEIFDDMQNCSCIVLFSIL